MDAPFSYTSHLPAEKFDDSSSYYVAGGRSVGPIGQLPQLHFDVIQEALGMSSTTGGGVDYGYDMTGKAIDLNSVDVTRFDDSSQNPYFLGFQNSTTWWGGRRGVDDARQSQVQMEPHIQPCEDRQSDLDSILPDQNTGFAATATTDYHRQLPYHQIPLLASSPEVLVPILTSEDTHERPSTPHMGFIIPTDDGLSPLSPTLSSHIHHVPLLPDQHSTYSELSANLAYMAAHSLRSPLEVVSSEPKKSTAAAAAVGVVERRKKKGKTANGGKSKRYKQGLELPDTAAGALIPAVDWTASLSTTRKLTVDRNNGNKRTTVEGCSASSSRVRAGIPVPRGPRGGTSPSQLMATEKSPSGAHLLSPGPMGKGVGGVGGSGGMNIGSSSSSRRGGGSGNNSSGGKKLGLACLFCRERKIACGRPSESHPDQTCNQCARRMFKCEYPTESRRGQHKRPRSKPDIT